MNNENGVPYGVGYMIVTLCRILPPLNKFECEHLGAKPEGGAVSSMKVAVPYAVMEETAASGNLDLLDLWVEDEFGFPWILAHGENMQFMSEESYKEWCNEV
tara:strand:+ start:2281 stop:2586 length:306 start_codon:yes stop_codon:yes gene_type:complete